MNLFLLSQTNLEKFIGVLASAWILQVSKQYLDGTCSRAILKSIVSMIEIRLYQLLIRNYHEQTAMD